jgi:RHH-type transcriptional regulator, proline utilization regulon repressor / proline dehydrogenase / delta 1-pyrroline-5-carboxylate dehydrogenase
MLRFEMLERGASISVIVSEEPDLGLGQAAVALAESVMGEAFALRQAAEQSQQTRLGRLLGSKASQQLGLVLTDRAYRASDDERSIRALGEAVTLLPSHEGLRPLDRAQIWALRALGPWVAPLSSWAVKARLRRESSAFVLDQADLEGAVQRLRGLKRRVNLNQLGEEVLGEKDAARYLRTTAALVERADVDAVSVKLSSLYSQVRVLAFESVVDAASRRLEHIFEAAARSRVLIYFDMEAYKDLDLTLEIFAKLTSMPSYWGVRAGVAIQAYLPDSLPALERVIELARRRVKNGGTKLRVRLVKGANLAAETVSASLHRLPVPIFDDKEQVDAHLKRLLRRVLRPENAEFLEVGLGSHNVFDQAYAVLLAGERGVTSMLELEMLFGMAESVGTAWAKRGHSVLVYAPAVAAESFPAAIAYLVRRLDENTSRGNFLAESLGMSPGDAQFRTEGERFLSALRRSFDSVVSTKRIQNRLSDTFEVTDLSKPFENASDTDWTRSWNRRALDEALEWAKTADLIVKPGNASPLHYGEPIYGFDPSLPGTRAYELRPLNAEGIEKALAKAARAQEAFGSVPAAERALLLERAAVELERYRLRLVAVMVKDAGKRAEEADVEVSEAVDFARYYAKQILALSEAFQVSGRGVTVITPPWNFPLAIPLGGCFAALAAGNAVLLKPAPETPLVAQAGIEALWRAGVPEEVCQFVPCDDSVASPLIVDERVQQVVLTGATTTARAFLRMRPRLRLLAETGGKNMAYVSALADREAAISSIVNSAFGHSGQKCSALSVLVLEDEVFSDEGFRRSLVDAAESLPVGSAWDLQSFVTPLIRPPEGPLHTVLRRGDGNAVWALRPRQSKGNPALVSPGILWGIPEGGFAHRTEFFGPVLSVLRARDLFHGLELMNASPYGLTAGIFSLSEGEQRRFVEEMDAGNLYINRGLTGAVVGRQPFGGRKASSFGPGAKAGGPGYLPQFAFLERRQKCDVPVNLERVHGTQVVGEANWLSYSPANVVLWIGLGAEESDVQTTLSAARAVGAVPVVFREPISNGGEAADGEARVPRFPLDAPRAILVDSKATRVRLIGQGSSVLWALVQELGLSVIHDEVTADIALEARHYLLEQSVSLSYHRHGNVSLKELHPLVQDPPETKAPGFGALS